MRTLEAEEEGRRGFPRRRDPSPQAAASETQSVGDMGTALKDVADMAKGAHEVQRSQQEFLAGGGCGQVDSD